MQGPADSKLRPGAGTIVAILAAADVWFLLLFNRGINMPDEGWYLLQGYEIARGRVPYLDLHAHMTPLGFFIQAALIKTFGFHVITGRVFAVLEGMAIILIALDIGRRTLSYPYSLVPALFYIPYSVALGIFPHYNLDSSFFLLVSLAFYIRYMDDRKARLLFLGGLFGGMAAMTKQTLGLPAAALPAITLFLTRGPGGTRDLVRRSFLPILGLALPAFILLVYLALNGALSEAAYCLGGIASLKKFFLLTVFIPAALLLVAGVSCVYAATRIISWSRSPWYAAPLLFALGALIFLIAGQAWPWQVTAPYLAALVSTSFIFLTRTEKGEPNERWILLRTYAGLLFAVSLLSSVDLGHVLIGSSGFVFFAGLFLRRLSRDESGRGFHKMGLVLLSALFLAGIWLDLSTPYMSYAMGPKWRQTEKVDYPGLELIRVSPEEALELKGALDWIDANAAPDDGIFVYPWDLALYPLAGRSPATYYLFFNYEVFNQRILMETIADLEEKKPKVAVLRVEGEHIKRVAFEPQAKAMEGYLFAAYEEAARFGSIKIMVRKGSVAEDRP